MKINNHESMKPLILAALFAATTAPALADDILFVVPITQRQYATMELSNTIGNTTNAIADASAQQQARLRAAAAIGDIDGHPSIIKCHSMFGNLSYTWEQAQQAASMSKVCRKEIPAAIATSAQKAQDTQIAAQQTHDAYVASVNAAYDVCKTPNTPDKYLDSATILLADADKTTLPEGAARLNVMALQCRLGVDQYNAAHRGVSADAIAAALNRDEALGEMIKNHTTNVTTLDLASDALTTIHLAQQKILHK